MSGTADVVLRSDTPPPPHPPSLPGSIPCPHSPAIPGERARRAVSLSVSLLITPYPSFVTLGRLLISFPLTFTTLALHLHICTQNALPNDLPPFFRPPPMCCLPAASSSLPGILLVFLLPSDGFGVSLNPKLLLCCQPGGVIQTDRNLGGGFPHKYQLREPPCCEEPRNTPRGVRGRMRMVKRLRVRPEEHQGEGSPQRWESQHLTSFPTFTFCVFTPKPTFTVDL